jgi:hypothetical protein
VFYASADPFGRSLFYGNGVFLFHVSEFVIGVRTSTTLRTRTVKPRTNLFVFRAAVRTFARSHFFRFLHAFIIAQSLLNVHPYKIFMSIFMVFTREPVIIVATKTPRVKKTFPPYKKNGKK